jgi:small nuclear ribonucleoprotein (snRNP)-like protein
LTRQAVNVGFPTPNFICETATRQAVVAGVFVDDTTSAAILSAKGQTRSKGSAQLLPTIFLSATASTRSKAQANFVSVFVAEAQTQSTARAVLLATTSLTAASFARGNGIAGLSLADVPGTLTATVRTQSEARASLVGVVSVTAGASPRSQARSSLSVATNTVDLTAKSSTASIGRTSLFLQVTVTAKSSTASSGRSSLLEDIFLTGKSVTISNGRSRLILEIHLSSSSSTQGKSVATHLDGGKVASELTSEDPLWVALEIDLIQRVSNVPFTLRLGNRGSLQRTVGGIRYQYEPRLQTDIVIGTSISIATDTAGTGVSTPFYQQPLRGQPNGGTISWIVDPSQGWYGITPSIVIGRTFRLYTGRTNQDMYADVDTDLTLVYTGHVVNYTFDVTANPPAATIQTTDASSELDKSLVDDLYPADFPIVSLQGRPKPQLWGRKFSIEPVLENQVSLTYRVTRIESGVVGLDDVTQLTVGGVPWRRVDSLYTVDLNANLTNLLAQYDALSPTLQADYDSVVGGDPANFNNGNGLQNKVNLVALLTLYQGLSGSQQTDYQLAISANTAFYNNTPSGILNKMGLINVRYYGLQGGQWMLDVGNGTVQLGSDPAGADVRVDAQAVGWETLTTAGLITHIATHKNVPVDTASMLQLDLDWGAGVGFYTGTDDANCLDALDRITSSQVCWWALDEMGAVKAGVFDVADFRSDLIFIGYQPGVPLDINLLPPQALLPVDPIPKMLNSLAQVGIIQPAYRVRVGYAGRANPESSFLGGATAQEQADLSAPELVADWSPALAANALYELSPSDGQALRLVNPRAQDVYISSLCNIYTDALGIRERLVQRVIAGIDHHLWSVTVRMEPTSVKLMSSVAVLWVDENNQNRTVYSGNFRVTSAIMNLGGGPQQLELWGIGSVDVNTRFSSSNAPPVSQIIAPIAISFTSFTVLSDAINGNVIANVFVATSNGSTFNGTLSVVDDTNTVMLNGNPNIGYTLVLERDLVGEADLGLHTVAVTATQSAFSISQDYSFIVLAMAPPPPVVGAPVLSLTFTPTTPALNLPVSNGDVVSIMSATWSDGTPFVGVFSFTSPYFDHSGDYAISGTNLVVNNADNLNAIAVVTTEHVSVMAIPTG